MEATPVNLNTILEQANEWTFDGDFRILQWMQKISQNLDTRARSTTENLDRLNNNVKSTNVALDNVANSLTALQFGNQFVECRVQDDDETSMGAVNEGEVMTNGVASTPKPSSAEILSAFLDNNLKVLRNCHEKYSIDLEDSDDEDERVEKTYIFKPLNPYNDKPLPHIFGSKEWCEKWHVGLRDDDPDNNYSGDEISEAYSQSSSASSPVPDNDSYETNSEFASSVSLNNDNMERNVNTLRRSKFENVSETSSSRSSMAKVVTNNHNIIREIHAASSSLSSQSKTDEFLRGSGDSHTPTRVKYPTPPRSNIPPYVDLFAEPPDDMGSTSSTPSLLENHIQNPINLFNEDVDDVFKHLAIAQSKRNDFPIPKERTNVVKPQPTNNEQTTIKSNENLPEKRKVPHAGVSVLPINVVAGATPLRTPKNLFDDDKDDDDDNTQTSNKPNEFTTEERKLPKTGVSVLPKIISAKEDNFNKPKAAPIVSTRTPINLFDDDDDDLDFLSAFAKKNEEKVVVQPKLLEKQIGSDNTFKINQITKSVDILKDTKISPAPAIKYDEKNSLTDRIRPQTMNVPKTNFVNLFDDDDDDDDDIDNDKFLNSVVSKTSNQAKTSTKTSAPAEIAKDNSTSTKSLANILKSSNLFDDDEDDDEDFFRTLSKKPTAPKPSLFTKKDEDENESDSKTKSPNLSSIKDKTVETSSTKIETKDVESNAVNTEKGLFKTSSELSLRNETKNDQYKINDLEDEDEDFMKSLPPIPASATRTVKNTIMEKSPIQILQSHHEDDDDFFENVLSRQSSMPKKSASTAEDKSLKHKVDEPLSEEKALQQNKDTVKNTIMEKSSNPIFQSDHEDNDDFFENVLARHSLISNKFASTTENKSLTHKLDEPFREEKTLQQNKDADKGNNYVSSSSPTLEKKAQVVEPQSSVTDHQVPVDTLQTIRDELNDNKSIHLEPNNNNNTEINKEEVVDNNAENTSGKIQKLLPDSKLAKDQNETPTLNEVESECSNLTSDEKKESVKEVVITDDQQEVDCLDSNSHANKADAKEILAIPDQENLTSLNENKLMENNTLSTEIPKGSRAEEFNPTVSNLNLHKTDNMSQKYDYNSSFLFDEPPDDDDSEFFDSLGKASNQSIAKYNSFDLDPDLYTEPQIQKQPNTEISSSSTYKGLQLFDDLPPEDDGFHEIMTQKPPEGTTTKRFNSVFYDDFDETLEALNANQQKISLQSKIEHSLLNRETPPDIDEDEIKTNLASKDDVDFKKSNLKAKDDSVDDIKLNLPSKDNVDFKETNLKAKDLDDCLIKPDLKKAEDNNKPVNIKRPISKIQLPNININVESLLPFSGGIPPSLKTTQKVEPKSVSKPIEAKSETTANDKKNVLNTSTETSHILPNVNRNRVRGPVNRRPSSRKARQEGYRISLLDEQQDMDKENEIEKTDCIQEPENKLSSYNKEENIPTKTTSAFQSLFDSAITSTMDIFKEPVNASKSIIKEKENTDNTLTQVLATKLPNVLKFSDEEDDILNDNISVQITKDRVEKKSEEKLTTHKKEEKMSNQLLQSDDEDDDDFFANVLSRRSSIPKKSASTMGDKSLTQKLNEPLREEKTLQQKKEEEKLITHKKEENDAKKSSSLVHDLFDNVTAATPSFLTEPVKAPISTLKGKENNDRTSTHKPVTKLTIDEIKFSDDEQNDNVMDKVEIQSPKNINEIADISHSTTSSMQINSDITSSVNISREDLLQTQFSQKTTPQEAGLLIQTTSPPLSNVSKIAKDKNSSKIFTDSESDDDLFFNLTSTSKSQATQPSKQPIANKSLETRKIIAIKKQQPQTSLFSDESDEDDDDFLKTPAAKTNVATKIKPKVQTQSKSIFSDTDESDDSDLFSSKSKVINQPIAKNSSESSNTKQSNKQTVADNPLADLL